MVSGFVSVCVSVRARGETPGRNHVLEEAAKKVKKIYLYKNAGEGEHADKDGPIKRESFLLDEPKSLHRPRLSVVFFLFVLTANKNLPEVSACGEPVCSFSIIMLDSSFFFFFKY